MSSAGESENSLAVKVKEPDDKSIKDEKNIKPSIEIVVDHGETSQMVTLKEALDTIRDTIIDSSSSPNSKSTTIAIKHCLTEKYQIHVPRSPNRSQIIETPSDKEERIPYPSPVSDWLDREGYDVSSGSIREIPDDRSDSIRKIPDDRSDSIRKIPVDRPKSGEKVPAVVSPDETSDSDLDMDRKKRVRPCDKQEEFVEEEPDSTQIVMSTETSPGYEYDVDMYSVGTGADPNEINELEDPVEDMQID